MPKPYYDHAGITIYHGDCREILLTLEPFDLMLTDPPYGIGESAAKNRSRSKSFGSKSHAPHNTKGRIISALDYGDFEWDQKPDDALLCRCLGIAYRSIIWGGNYFTKVLAPNPGWLVWDKINSGDFADCELAWTNLPQACRIFRHMWNGMIRESERDAPRVHPTQKPIALMKWCLGFAPDAKTMIDPFCGSGSSLVAAKARGMTATGIDLEEKYCEIAAKRLSQEVLDFK